MRLAALVLMFAGLACAHRPWDQPSEAWVTVESPHFQILTDASPDAYAPVVRRLEDVHAALSTTFFKGVSIPRADVLLFGSESDFKGLVSRDVGGFYVPQRSSTETGLLVFPAAGEAEWIDRIGAHELAHRFMDAMAPRAPAWLNEGFANYAESLTILEDRAVFDTAELHGGYAYFHDPVPLSGMLAATYGSFHAGDRVAHYMTAWMMLRHLLARPGTDPKQRFRTLVGAVAAARTAQEQAGAIEASFGVSVDQLQREILALHSAVYHGVGQPRSRQAVAVRFERSGDPATTVKPADRAEVKALCSALRAAAGR